MTASHGALLTSGLLLAIGGAALIAAALRQKNGRREVERRLAAVLAGVGEGQAVLDDGVLRNAQANGSLRRHLLFILQSAGGWRTVRPICLAGLGIAAGTAFVAERVFLVGAAAPAIGLSLGALFIQRMVSGAIRRRRRAFFDHLPAAIELIVRSAQAGIPVTEAIAVAGADLSGPVAAEFTEISHLLRLGVDIRTALLQSAERVGLLDFDCFVTALVVQRETGGQLSETLQNLAGIIRRRKEMHAKTKGMTAEGRLTAKLLAALPLVLAGLMTLTDPNYMKPLIADSTGRHLLLLSCGMIIGGSLLIQHLTRSEM
jgi:Flp pilus assembly protein TadB